MSGPGKIRHADVPRRERMHRRGVVLGLAILLLVGMSPLVASQLPLGLDHQLASRDHLWALCLAALHVILTPVHGLFHLLFLAGIVYAGLDRCRAWLAQRRALEALHARIPNAQEPVARAAAAVGLPTSALRLVTGLPSPAFTVGWIRPRIYLAESLPTTLPTPELEAVLAHEAAHVRRRDPLRLSLLRFLRCTLFWLPAVAKLAEDVADEAEVRADDDAARDRPLALAAALVTLATWPRPVSTTHDGVAFNERDLLERRVRRLAGEEVPPRSRLTLRSVVGALAALTLAWSSGAVASHPQPGSLVGPHCEHLGAPVLLHLLCPGSSSTAAHDDCPHREHKAEG